MCLSIYIKSNSSLSCFNRLPTNAAASCLTCFPVSFLSIDASTRLTSSSSNSSRQALGIINLPWSVIVGVDSYFHFSSSWNSIPHLFLPLTKNRVASPEHDTISTMLNCLVLGLEFLSSAAASLLVLPLRRVFSRSMACLDTSFSSKLPAAFHAEPTVVDNCLFNALASSSESFCFV
jgi:hypothetical protein